MSDKINVLNNERKYMGEFYDHADQLLDNLEDIKDIFDKYLAAKLYNWRYEWFCDHYYIEDINSIPYNVCMNWPMVLDKYFEDVEDDGQFYLLRADYYSNLCRAKIDNEGLVPYYFRYCIPFPDEFMHMLNDTNATNEDGERVLIANMTQLQLEVYEKEQQDYEWV
ncbi:hypothetical protein [carnivorous sponge associated iridovirus]|jgi:hypothetical protein|nr:hypothetical protein [carnivorous sponge associated iridovirus]